MTPDILFLDPHLLVINKPAGMTTEDCTLLLRQIVKEKEKKAGNVFLEPIHQIDRPVSGILIFAKRSKALSRMHAFLRERQFHKCYLACVEGVPIPAAGECADWLIHADYHAKIVSKNTPQAKYAHLSYRTLHKNPPYSFLEIDLTTGRYHQIRVQMASLGTPIFGDTKYGGSPWQPHRIALHHFRCEVLHPISRELLSFQAPLSEDFPWF